MAFGTFPHHSRNITFPGLTREQFLVLAVEAARGLNWQVGYCAENGFIAYTEMSVSFRTQQIKVTIENEKAVLRSESTGIQLIDWGKNKENIDDLIYAIQRFKVGLDADDITAKYEELKSRFATDQGDQLNQLPATTRAKVNYFIALFRPTEGYFVTPLLIDANIVLFIVMVATGVNVLLPTTENLLHWGANFRPSMLAGDWWRLITSCFLHIGIFHLLMNMYALTYIGLVLEPYLGKTRFAVAYFMTGICSSLASLWAHPLMVSAGASGAIFGMYGVFLAMLTTNFIERATRKTLLTSIAIFVGYNLLNGLKAGVDNAAHIGGLVSGIAIGYGFIPSLRRSDEPKLKYWTSAGIMLVVLVTSFVAYKKIPDDIGQYDKLMKEFVANESMALEAYQLPANTSKDDALTEIKDRGIYYWNENIKLIKKTEDLDLPSALYEQDKKLLRYCRLRLANYHLIYEAVKENRSPNADSIESYNNRINAIIDDLKNKK